MLHEAWHLVNQHEETLSFTSRSDDPECISVYFFAGAGVLALDVGASLGVCDYRFENNGMPHRVHKDFARAVWNGLVQKAGWQRVLAVA